MKAKTLRENSDPPEKGEAGPSRVRIVEGILKQIFSGRFLPGDRLVTDRLAREFQVSQTPIREAIGTLAGMGVLVVKPNCGAVVRPFSPREVRDICQVRRRLETLAIVTACGRIPKTKLQSLREQMERQSKLSLPISRREIELVKKSDTLLHDLIRNATRNQFLADELDRIMVLVRAIRDAAWYRLWEQSSPDLAFVVVEAKEHLEIIDGLLNNDPKRAQRALHRHLQSGARYIVRAVEE
jgi:DNA-binding GntR family transcriptional regulator